MKKKRRNRKAGSPVVNRNHKANLFAWIFGAEENRICALELYNALNGTDYDDPDSLRISTVETALYLGMRNDVSFSIEGTLNLYEHQSTWNPNIPLRCLFNVMQHYAGDYAKKDYSLYSTVLQQIPAPRCVVFYNGSAEMPERCKLKLSDAFIDGQSGDVEVIVHVFNINPGNNAWVKEKCSGLREYCSFVENVRRAENEGKDISEAVAEAIEKLPQDGRLRNFLQKNRAEVNMIMFEEKTFEEAFKDSEYRKDNQIRKLQNKVNEAEREIAAARETNRRQTQQVEQTIRNTADEYAKLGLEEERILEILERSFEKKKEEIREILK